MPHAEFKELQELPADRLLTAMGDAVFVPVVAGESLPRHPFDPDAPSISADVPMLIGTNKDDLAYFTLFDPPREFFDAKSVQSALVQFLWSYGVDEAWTELSIKAYRELHPAASWQNCFVGIATNVFRDDAIIQAERKSALGRAPAYMYLFTWESPAYDGLYGSCHTFEIPFVFDNVNAASQLYGQGTDSRLYELATTMSKAWSGFAHSGRPESSALPRWEPYTVSERATMILNYSCEITHDPNREDRLAFERLRAVRLSQIKKWKSQ